MTSARALRKAGPGGRCVGNVAAILGELSGQGGAGKEPSVFGGPVGNDPELRHPGQWHLNVQVGMRKPNFSSFIQQVFIEDQLFARRGSGFWGLVLRVSLGKHAENSLPACGRCPRGETDKTNYKGGC